MAPHVPWGSIESLGKQGVFSAAKDDGPRTD
eukprot:CAMPEP_0182838542 /NCGR_PEP_ID=MMETSP0006_2-20121128/23365_1 /TAXON_ID=97485 /ORGANISM="Prymnesium parvum, Strain Texoma1" /LENGTH=30 /DNA_ID= /DNA_START= /DNA_END= /DNA_ORIENTATION=